MRKLSKILIPLLILSLLCGIFAIVGSAEEPAPKVEPMHPVSDTTSKFANLQFGRNYDPNSR
jgi:hypothetical protein